MMGGQTFETKVSGKTAEIAFKYAVESAQYDCGHGGYTGTIAEKPSFTMIDLPEGVEPHAHASKLIDDGDPRVDDKWGPAGCFAIGEEQWFFFGWASC